MSLRSGCWANTIHDVSRHRMPAKSPEKTLDQSSTSSGTAMRVDIVTSRARTCNSQVRSMVAHWSGSRRRWSADISQQHWLPATARLRIVAPPEAVSVRVDY